MRVLIMVFLLISFAYQTLGQALAQPPTRYQKLTAVLNHLHIPEEPSYFEELKLWDETQTYQGFQTLLKYVDPAHELERYAKWDTETFTLYRDRDEKELVDFSLRFKQDGVPGDPKGLLKSLRKGQMNPKAKPLLGYRIALDPGHFGTRNWDTETGKYIELKKQFTYYDSALRRTVTIPAKSHVSEGEIAFQVCTLLYRELKKLGATVLLTRRGLTPVTTLNPEHYDIEPFYENELRSSTDDIHDSNGFFEKLLNRSNLFDELFALFDSSALHGRIAKLKSESKRLGYFITRADLDARAKLINDFHPDLTLIVHFDADELDRLQTSDNEVRGFVFGDVLNGELAARANRASLVRSLFDGQRWMQSNYLTASVASGISHATGIKLRTVPDDVGAVRVNDGVYARNLALTRLVSEGASAYIEVFYYSYAHDFHELLKKDKHTRVEEIKLDYSSRVDDIVDGFRQGILDYVESVTK